MGAYQANDEHLSPVGGFPPARYSVRFLPLRLSKAGGRSRSIARLAPPQGRVSGCRSQGPVARCRVLRYRRSVPWGARMWLPDLAGQRLRGRSGGTAGTNVAVVLGVRTVPKEGR